MNNICNMVNVSNNVSPTFLHKRQQLRTGSLLIRVKEIQSNGFLIISALNRGLYRPRNFDLMIAGELIA